MKIGRILCASALALMAPLAAAQNQLSIATGGTGGVYYPLGGGIAELINKHMDGYKAVAEVTGASVENMGLIARRDSDVAFALADTVYQAYHGTGRFDGNKLPVRAIAAVYPNAVQIVTLGGSDIKSLQDLKGKRVSVGAPGSGTEVNAKALLEANGINYEDMTVQRLNFNETADALRDGQIDAGFWSVGPPTSSILNLAATRDIKLLSLTADEVANARKAEPVFAPYTLREGTYDKVGSVATIGIPNVLVVSAEMSDEVAHAITKLIFEKTADLIAIHPAANDTTVDFSLGSSPIPLHPGAIRFYESAGHKVPDSLKP